MHFMRLMRCVLARMLLIVAAVVCGSAFFAPAYVSAATFVVRCDGDNGSATPAGLGDDWGTGHAYKYLQDALVQADYLLVNEPTATLVEVWVAGDDDTDGIIYYPDEGAGLSNNSRALTFNLREKVHILCGFVDGDLDRNDRNCALNKVVLSGDIDQDGLDGGNSRHVVTASYVDATAWLDGATITGGYANNDNDVDDDGRGGAIIILGGSTFDPSDACEPAILRCRCTANYALEGGAVYIRSSEGSSVVFRNC